MTPFRPHDHDLGLQHDLGVMRRRRMLGLMTAGGAGLLLGSVAGVGRAADAVGPTCPVLPAETNGPFPSDGSNSAGRSLSNALIESGVVRSDVRASFGALKGTAEGVPLDLTIRLANAGKTCAPLAGYVVYIWACDAAGRYSIYETPTQNYLRGVQAANDKGEVKFTTIFPGAYPGRYPHLHFEVFAKLDSAKSFRSALLISQFALPADVCTAVYATSAYPGSARIFAGQTMTRDGVFADNSPAQLAAMTPRLTGDAKSGLKAEVTVGLVV